MKPWRCARGFIIIVIILLFCFLLSTDECVTMFSTVATVITAIVIIPTSILMIEIEIVAVESHNNGG